MLKEIIGIIRNGKTVSVENLSVQLGIRREMTAVLLENLEITGYLKKVSDGKGSGIICSRCCKACSSKVTELGLWVLCEKR